MKKYILLLIFLFTLPIIYAIDCDRISYKIQKDINFTRPFVVFMNWDDEICVFNRSCFGELDKVEINYKEGIYLVQDKIRDIPKDDPRMFWEFKPEVRNIYEISIDLKSEDKTLCTKAVTADFINIAEGKTLPEEIPESEADSIKGTRNTNESKVSSKILDSVKSQNKINKPKDKEENPTFFLLLIAAFVAIGLIVFVLYDKKK